MTPPAQTERSITRADCLALLAPGGDGRVAATMRAIPVIVPVTFTLLGEDVIFRPDPDEATARAVDNAVVAFETDQVGSEAGVRWYVHVTGVARAVTGIDRGSSFRLSSALITGRRAGG